MNPLIELNKAAIIELCKKHYVQKLYLFGSALNHKFNEKSDVDFLYEIRFDSKELDYASNLFDLEASLEKLLNRKVDMVRHNFELPNLFIKAVGENKELIYAQ